MTAKRMSRKITEKMLLDGYDGKTKGWDNISLVEGKRILWTYRTSRQDDGYNVACPREKAREITLEYDRAVTVVLDSECDTHPAIAKIADDEAKMGGDRVSI